MMDDGPILVSCVVVRKRDESQRGYYFIPTGLRQVYWLGMRTVPGRVGLCETRVDRSVAGPALGRAPQ